jgi:transcriptional regulator with XRE-family HTH domain
MENTHEINEKIAKNLAYYRKTAGLTQAELAQKINYSDKSVSKWESGGGIPDVYILMQLADLYGVSLDALVGKEEAKKSTSTAPQKIKTGMHFLIVLLSSGLVWLVATIGFVALSIGNAQDFAWMCFIYATLATAIVFLVYACIWKYHLLNFISVSALIWMAILSVYVTLEYVFARMQIEMRALWLIFLLGIPLQVLEILWTFFRSLFKKNVRMSKTQSTQNEKNG